MPNVEVPSDGGRLVAKKTSATEFGNGQGHGRGVPVARVRENLSLSLLRFTQLADRRLDRVLDPQRFEYLHQEIERLVLVAVAAHDRTGRPVTSARQPAKKELAPKRPGVLILVG